jgi:hypothetical protein
MLVARDERQIVHLRARREEAQPDRWSQVQTEAATTWSTALAVLHFAQASDEIGRLAARRKQTRSGVIRDSIALLAARERDQSATSYARIAHLVGCFDSGGARLSEQTGSKVRAVLARRRRERGPR